MSKSEFNEYHKNAIYFFESFNPYHLSRKTLTKCKKCMIRRARVYVYGMMCNQFSLSYLFGFLHFTFFEKSEHVVCYVPTQVKTLV